MAEPIDPGQLEQLINDHGAALELFAAQWSLVPEDCVQDAFLELIRQRTRPDNTLAWLYRVVRNRAISWRRAYQRRRRRETIAAEQRNWFTSARWSSAELEEVTEALRSVDEEFREVVIARIWGALSFEQIATVISTSSSTAHRRYESGLRQLRERLGVQWQTNTDSTTS
jgi:RNA polymerase sigma-70 factor (ECF subfamily)